EVQGRQAAPAAGADEVLPGEQNQSVRLLPAARAAAARIHLAVLHAAHRPEEAHLWQEPRRTLQRAPPCGDFERRAPAFEIPCEHELRTGGAALGEVPL